MATTDHKFVVKNGLAVGSSIDVINSSGQWVGATGTLNGATGPTGATGIQGASGATGTQGASGVGATGAQGIGGATGAQGIQGASGVQGASGIQGASGATGTFSASSGYQMVNLRVGATGASGATGSITASELNVVANTSVDAVRITQTGAGNALVVEDSANPDSSPFVIDAAGNVIQGYTANITSNAFQANSSNPFSGIRWNAASTGSTITIGKSRSATIGTRALVSSGDTLSTITFAGDDGTNFIQAAAVSSAVDGTPGTNDMPGRLTFLTTADGASTSTERMRIDSSGNVVIGNTVATQKLDVVGSGDVAIRIRNNDGIADFFTQSAGDVFLTAQSAGKSLLLGTVGTERMRIDATGNILVAQAARGTITTDNDLSFNMNAASNFKCTPTALGTLTFTNITSGQSGWVLLVNTGGYAISAAATTEVSANALTTISTAGTYLLSYFTDGTLVYVTNSGALA